MTNYYDNKSKNLFVMISIFALFVSALLQTGISILNLLSFGEATFFETLKSLILNAPVIISIFTGLVLFIFAVSIFIDFKFKKCMLPIYFGMSCCLKIYSFVSSIYLYSKYQMTYSLNVSTIFSIIIFALLFIGSLNNFKFIAIFKIGLLAQIINIGYNVVKSIFVLISSYFETINYPSFNSYSFLTLTNICGILAITIQLLLPISLLVLVTRKKQDKIPNEEPQTNE